MKKLQLSSIITPEVQGDEKFFARKVRAKDFEGLMDPVIGFDHFELTKDIFGPHPHAGMSALSYVFEDSAPYQSIDSLGNNVYRNTRQPFMDVGGQGRGTLRISCARRCKRGRLTIICKHTSR